ncbi:hypothetical protein MRB53_030551 [Persea americana]|uniref:Uncharacterized protein n=1 Tax=Persea americana TaxID=3435 RepID=A0ACC2KMM0_PERAE|nr:hypothetical protein MRB53_030551 [Persea americana]
MIAVSGSLLLMELDERKMDEKVGESLCEMTMGMMMVLEALGLGAIEGEMEWLDATGAVAMKSGEGRLREMMEMKMCAVMKEMVVRDIVVGSHAICGATTASDDCLPTRFVLSLQQPVYGNYQQDLDVPAPAPPPAISPAGGDDDMRISGSSSSESAVVSNGIFGLQSFLMSSKYMKAAQQLLDEVASIREDFKTDSNEGSKGQLKGSGDSLVAEAFNGVKSMENGQWCS